MSYRKDELLFKKIFAKKAITENETNRPFYAEPYNSPLSLYSNNIWTETDKLPLVAPLAWVSSASYSEDDIVYYGTGTNVLYLCYKAKTNHSGVATVPSSDTTNWEVFTQLKFANKVSMTVVSGAPYSYYDSDLQDSIPFSFGTTGYGYVFRKSTGAIIPFGEESWTFDTESGVVYFHTDSNPTAIGTPTMECFVYEGKKLDNQLTTNNIGVGTNAPTELLHIAGTSDPTLVIQNTSDNDANSGKIAFKEASNTVERVGLRYDGSANKFIIDTEEISNAFVIDRVTGDITIAGDLTITSDFNVLGTETTINTATLTVDDIEIVIGDVATPSDLTADTGGFRLKGTTDKTINWMNSTDSWHFNQGITLEDDEQLYFDDSNILMYAVSPGNLNITANATANIVSPILDIDASTSVLIDTNLTAIASTTSFSISSTTTTITSPTTQIIANTLLDLDTSGDLDIDAADTYLDGTNLTIVESVTAITSPTTTVTANTKLQLDSSTEVKTTTALLDINADMIAADGTVATFTYPDINLVASTEVDINSPTINLNSQSTNIDLVSAVGALTFESTLLTLDTTNSRVGIGTATPTGGLEIANDYLNINNVGSDKKIKFNRTGGTTFSIEHDADRIYFYNGANDILTMLNGGNVGIGTITPDTNLDIEDSTPTIRLTNSGGSYGEIVNNGGGFNIYNDQGEDSASSRMKIFIDTTQFFTFTGSDNGRLGIGQTSPVCSLDIGLGDGEERIRINKGDTDTGQIQFSSNTATNWGIIHNADENLEITSDLANADFLINIMDGGSAKEVFKIDASEPYSLFNNCDVGIGLTAPTGLLHIQAGASGQTADATSELILEDSGSAAFSILTPDDEVAYIFFGNPDSSTSGAIKYVGGTHATTALQDNMIFRTNNTDQMRLDGQGNLGIGIQPDTPGTRLHISGGDVELETGHWFDAKADGYGYRFGNGDCQIRHSTEDMIFETSSGLVESFRIKANQNILVGVDNALEFRDTAIYINSSTDGQLDIDADGEVEITSPILDVDATTLTMDGTTGTITYADKLTLDSTTETEMNTAFLDVNATSLQMNGDESTVTYPIMSITAGTLWWLTATTEARISGDLFNVDSNNLDMDGDVGNIFYADKLNLDSTTETEMNTALLDVNATKLTMHGTDTGTIAYDNGLDVHSATEVDIEAPTLDIDATTCTIDGGVASTLDVTYIGTNFVGETFGITNTTNITFTVPLLNFHIPSVDMSNQAVNFDLKDTTVNAFSFDTERLTIDTLNKRLGVNTTAPFYGLDMNEQLIGFDALHATVPTPRAGMIWHDGGTEEISITRESIGDSDLLFSFTNGSSMKKKFAMSTDPVMDSTNDLNKSAILHLYAQTLNDEAVITFGSEATQRFQFGFHNQRLRIDDSEFDNTTLQSTMRDSAGGHHKYHKMDSRTQWYTDNQYIKGNGSGLHIKQDDFAKAINMEVLSDPTDSATSNAFIKLGTAYGGSNSVLIEGFDVNIDNTQDAGIVSITNKFKACDRFFVTGSTDADDIDFGLIEGEDVEENVRDICETWTTQTKMLIKETLAHWDSSDHEGDIPTASPSQDQIIYNIDYRGSTQTNQAVNAIMFKEDVWIDPYEEIGEAEINDSDLLFNYSTLGFISHLKQVPKSYVFHPSGASSFNKGAYGSWYDGGLH